MFNSTNIVKNIKRLVDITIVRIVIFPTASYRNSTEITSVYFYTGLSSQKDKV